MQTISSRVHVLGFAILFFFMACTTAPQKNDQPDTTKHKQNQNNILTNKIASNKIEAINKNTLQAKKAIKNQNTLADKNKQKVTSTINKQSKVNADQIKADNNSGISKAQIKPLNKKPKEKVVQENKEASASKVNKDEFNSSLSDSKVSEKNKVLAVENEFSDVGVKEKEKSIEVFPDKSSYSLVSIEVSSYSNVFIDDKVKHSNNLQTDLSPKNKLVDKELSSASFLINNDNQIKSQSETDVDKSQENTAESFNLFNTPEKQSENKYQNDTVFDSPNTIENKLVNNVNHSSSLTKKAALLTVTDAALNKLNDKDDFKGEVFNIVKQANELISEDNKKNITDSLSINIDQLLSFNWTLFVPAKGQYSDSKYSYCLKVLDEMRAGSYQVQTPFKINFLDQNEWEQHLDGVTLVQLSDVELELYTIKENSTSFNVVASVFNADKTLSTILPGVSSANDQFFGVFAYSDFNQRSVGGAGRFYSKDTIKNIQSYLIKWNLEYYLLNAEVKDRRYRLLEIIPLLASQQKLARNCRWRQ